MWNFVRPKLLIVSSSETLLPALLYVDDAEEQNQKGEPPLIFSENAEYVSPFY